MPAIKPNLESISQIAWTLALASAQDQLDVPGEYIWAFPLDNSFQKVRERSRSIFSSGNSIKDPEIIDFIQNTNLSPHLLDPWVVQKFEERWPQWIAAGSQYRLDNFDLFKYVGYSQGTQETFLNFYIMNKDKRFRVFRGDYWWHMDIWHKGNFQWAYIEDDDIKPGDVCLCSYPFALTGRRHENFHWLVETCDKQGVELLVDFIYLPNSMDQEVDIDLSADCIKTITFSLSKTFPVQCAKIAVRMCKNKPQDPMQMSNDENINNRLGAGLGLDVIERFPVDFMVRKYRDMQHHWCQRLGLTPTKVVHFALGEPYTKYGRNSQHNWCSPFNEQHNRYNLGMLFENQRLLSRLEI